MLAWQDDPLYQYIHIGPLLVRAKPESDVRDAVREAIQLSLMENRGVRLLCGEREYDIAPEAIIKAVLPTTDLTGSGA